MNIRIIYDYDISKNKKQYIFLKYILKNINEFVCMNEEYYFFKNNTENFVIQPYYKFNIFLDIVSDYEIKKLPSDYNILIVNDKYLLNDNLLRRESYKNIPLKNLDDVIHYYFCLTKYSYNIILNEVNKNKVFLMDGLVSLKNIDNVSNISKKNNSIKENKDKNWNKYVSSSIFSEVSTKKNTLSTKNIKYIYYLVDPYSKQDNIILLKVWIKYYLERKEHLIIHLKHKREDIVKLMLDLLETYYFFEDNIYFYKNIIFYYNDKYTKLYEKQIYCNIINCSYFSLITSLQYSITNNIYIITKKNDISLELLCKNTIYYDNFNEKQIILSLNKLFKMKQSEIIKQLKSNINNISTKYKDTLKVLNKLELIQ